LKKAQEEEEEKAALGTSTNADDKSEDKA